MALGDGSSTRAFRDGVFEASCFIVLSEPPPRNFLNRANLFRAEDVAYIIRAQLFYGGCFGEGLGDQIVHVRVPPLPSPPPTCQVSSGPQTSLTQTIRRSPNGLISKIFLDVLF